MADLVYGTAGSGSAGKAVTIFDAETKQILDLDQEALFNFCLVVKTQSLKAGNLAPLPGQQSLDFCHANCRLRIADRGGDRADRTIRTGYRFLAHCNHSAQ